MHPLALFVVIGFSVSLHGATFDVRNTNDDGPGSLRQAILDANSNPGIDTITFTLPQPGPYTINLSNGLPIITDPIRIDGTTQPGYAGKPIVELSGANAGSGAIGLFIQANNCTVRGLVINRFVGDGIRIVFSGGSRIEGNFIGTDRTGKVALGNTFGGVTLNNASNVTIGGTSPELRNLISGGNLVGIYIIDLTSTGNKVQGNFIGTDVEGRTALGNLTDGIQVYRAPNNLIGGSEPGAQNVISANGETGIFIFGNGAKGNLVQGNFIGTDVSGARDLGNRASGVNLVGAVSNVIGGTVSAARNVISGNDGAGIFLVSGAVGNLVQGNFIGTDLTGRIALGNQTTGVQLADSSNNVFGGTIVSARNVVSGNGQSGFYLTNSVGNRVEGNFIGTDETGMRAVRNTSNGVALVNAAENLVGGAVVGAGNLISGNGQSGVLVIGATATANRVQGNLIGTDATGTLDLGNVEAGVALFGAPTNLIGGILTAARNVISSNDKNGIFISGMAATGNQIQGNFVGSDSSGTRALGNAASGVWLLGAPGNLIGGLGPSARNIISGNGSVDRLDGIDIEGSSAIGNRVQGNFIGTDVSGTLRMGNFYGILLSGASSNLIGGAALGAGNLISGNSDNGIALRNATGNILEGNYLGTDVTGTVGLGNFNGVAGYNTSNNLIGGPTAGAGNLLSANANTGIYLTNSMDDRVQGNRIGIQADGIRPLGNSAHGVELLSSSRDTIGGLGLGESNIIAHASMSGFDGVRIRSGTGNIVRGNSILANAGLGIDLGVDGVTQNDLRDGDSGGNDLQNFPLLTSAASTRSTVIVGTLNSVPNRNFIIDFYANDGCDPSGSGEGQGWFGMASVRTDGSGNATFNVVLTNVSISFAQRFVTATATDPDNNTSEFSPCIEATVAPTLRVTFSTNVLVLSWPTATQGYTLEATESLSPPVNWIPMSTQGTIGNEFVVTNSLSGTNRFYRLRK